MQQKISVFDNDGTLYDCPIDFERAITAKMIDFLARSLHINEKEVMEKRENLFRKYGIRSTLLVFYFEGIIKDRDAFVQETYLAINPSLYGIKPNPQLKETLMGQFGGDFIVHTNNPAAFAERILTHLGIRDSFDRIFGMFENNLYQKPDIRAFQPLLQYIIGYRAKQYIDNEVPNIIVAERLGFATTLVSEAINSKGDIP